MADHAPSSSSFLYDVFLSFRGYTRHTFTDHLYHALIEKGVNAFRDTENLRIGDEIGPNLVEAIERSKISIPVLCQNYATSKWCLDELAKIMECSENGRKRPVLPVFYHVVPSDLRYQRYQFETAMEKLENRYGKDSDKVRAWRSALYAVCELSGVDCKDRSESDIIKKIVGEVFKRLPREPLHIKHQVELDSRIKDLISLLDMESHDTLYMLCIYGDGETNKTEFVGTLYNKISDEFDAACFLENVSEKSKKSINGMEDLQNILLSVMDHEAKTTMGSKFRGCSEIKRRLRNKRVLLILDDVDSVEQLDSLAGGADWFGPGSRIIITTRDEDIASEDELCGVEIKKYFIDKCEFEGKEDTKSDDKQKRDVREADVVGFEDSLSIVIDQLKKVDSFRNVVSITGTGGLGKTTLARKIYKNNEVKKLFPFRAWSCVSKDFSERRVFLSLLSCLNSFSSHYEDLSEEKLKEEVRKCLITNKYLVVLDDIWKPEVWDKLKDAFPNNNNGSMILITSRNDQVAYYTRSRSPPHKLLPLDVEESWKLFCRKVFGKEECPLHLKPIGKSIVEGCGGLPLAITTIAGLVVKNERSLKEWSQIKGLVPWNLAEDSTKVKDVLNVSYDNLPETLKKCFLYFGIYPEDYEIVARELIQLWMAEGFIQPEKTRKSKIPRPEDIGDKYLNELVERNLVQVVERRADGGVKICRIHNLFRELCILKSEVNNFLKVCAKSTKISLGLNRLSFLGEPRLRFSIKYNWSSAHSLFFFARMSCQDDIMTILIISQELKVLHLARHVLFEKVPNDLKKNMTHLKYLRIEGFNSTTDIPDWIWSLYNIETLDLRGWVSWKGSICIWKLEQLRHIYTKGPVKLEEDEEGAISKPMWNLQTLTMVDLVRQTMLLINNGCFPNLSKLGLSYGLPSISGDSLQHEPLLWNLHCLNNLLTLKIEFCFGKFSSFHEIVFPPNIYKITLRRIVEVDDCGCMSALGRIPNLRVLNWMMD